MLPLSVVPTLDVSSAASSADKMKFKSLNQGPPELGSFARAAATSLPTFRTSSALVMVSNFSLADLIAIMVVFDNPLANICIACNNRFSALISCGLVHFDGSKKSLSYFFNLEIKYV